ncbi:MAG: hypothetical protein ACRDOD_24695, partial [Streptosporangiaceae bacterium]
PEPLRQVAPRSPGPGPEEDPVDHQPVIIPPVSLPRMRRQQRLQPRPFTIRQIVPYQPVPVHEGNPSGNDLPRSTGHALALLIHNAPAALRLILSGRSLPELHVARMRVAGTLSEVMPADLACTAEEAEGYFAALGLTASAAERDQLLGSVEGWMASPRLASLIAARDGALGAGAIVADPIVADYLRDEVLDQQAPAVRRFLRRTSVAERLTGGFADWLTGEHGGTRILDQLSRTGSFVSRDAQGKYRYHPFLRQVLLGELRGGMPAEVPGLFGRAARWHTRDGDAIEAVRCWAETGDWEHASLALTEAGLAGVLPDRVGELETALGLFFASGRGAVCLF